MNKKLAIVLSIMLVFSSVSVAFASTDSGAVNFLNALEDEFGDLCDNIDEGEFLILCNILKGANHSNIFNSMESEMDGLKTKLASIGVTKSDLLKVLSIIQNKAASAPISDFYEYMANNGELTTALESFIVDVEDQIENQVPNLISSLTSYMKDDKVNCKGEFMVEVIAAIYSNVKIDIEESPWTIHYTSSFNSAVKSAFTKYTKLDIDSGDIFELQSAVSAGNVAFYNGLNATAKSNLENVFAKMGIIVIHSEPGSGSSGGSGGGSHDVDSTDKANDNVDKLADNLDKKTATQAVNAVEDLIDKDLKKVLDSKKIDGDEAAEVVDKTLDVVNKVLNKEDISAKEAKNLASKVVNNVVKELLGSSDISATEAANIVDDVIDNVLTTAVQHEDMSVKDQATLLKYAINNNLSKVIDKDKSNEHADGLVEKIEKLASDVVNKAGAVAENSIKVKGTKATIDTKEFEKSIKAVSDITGDLEKAMTKAGVETPKVEGNVSVDVSKDVENVSLPMAAMKAAAKSGVGVGLDFGEAKFVIPPAFAGLTGENLDITVKKADEKANEATDKLAKENGLNPTGANYNFDVANDKGTINSFAKKISISIPLTAVPKSVDVNKLCVYIVNPTTNEFEYVKSTIVDGKVVFEAPHFSIYTILEYTKVFSDTVNHWAKEDIEYMAARQIAKGFEDNKFMPDGTMTRAEFTVLMVRAIGLEGTGVSKFADINTEDWFANEVALAADRGIVTGNASNEFMPSNNINREQMAVMVARAYKVMKNEELTGTSLNFNDKAIISNWAVSAIEGAVSKSIITGYDDNTFKPAENATRAQGIVILKRLIQD